MDVREKRVIEEIFDSRKNSGGISSSSPVCVPPRTLSWQPLVLRKPSHGGQRTVSYPSSWLVSWIRDLKSFSSRYHLPRSTPSSFPYSSLKVTMDVSMHAAALIPFRSDCCVISSVKLESSTCACAFCGPVLKVWGDYSGETTQGSQPPDVTEPLRRDLMKQLKLHDRRCDASVSTSAVR